MVKKEIVHVTKKILGIPIKPTKPKRREFSEETKNAILKIQKYHCAVPGCKYRGRFHFDHIRGNWDNRITNCQALCPNHHDHKSRRDAVKLRVYKAQLRRKKAKKSEKD